MNIENIIVIIEQFQSEVKDNIEWLQTTEGDEVECISIENLEGIIKRTIGYNIRLSTDLPEPEEPERKVWSAMQGGTDGG